MSLRGLSPAEVTERRLAGLTNHTTTKSSKSVAEIITSNLFTYFNFIFLVIAILLLTANSPLRNFSFVPVVVANSLIGIIQELRAKRVLDRLEVLHAPTARVLRASELSNTDKLSGAGKLGGTGKLSGASKLSKIPVSELVQDDIILLKTGDQIPADAKIIEGEISVNEALLTGESDEITKNLTHPELLSGSFVVNGQAYAKLTRVGNSSYAAELTLKAKAIKAGEQSKIIASLNKFVRLAGIALIPIGVILVVRHLLGGATYTVAIESMVAATIGMIPEGLFLLASVTLALSAMRLARQKVLLHDMKSIETLARADVLCVDKTGTITSGQMKVHDTVWLRPNTDYVNLLCATVQALPADSDTMSVLKSAYVHQTTTSPPTLTPTHLQGFTSRLKYSGVTFGRKTYVIGAPELVLRDAITPLQAQITKYSQAGYRVLVFAEYHGQLRDAPLTARTTALALIILEDTIRPTAPQTFAFFKEQNVAIKVISGDSPLTVSAIAQRAGISGAEHYIDLSQPLTDAALKKAAQKYTVFGRVTPDDKRRLVKALQAAGHTVAMTGDGVNDVLALKDADCSIAMASGADAAAGAAQMVLLDSDFAQMPTVVHEGRRVVNNLERSGSLFIVKNLVSFSAAILVILTGLIYPLVPAQVSFISLWAIGIPSFLLAQIGNTRLIKGQFMRNILSAAIPSAIVAVIALTLITVFSRLFQIDTTLTSTLSALTWAGVALSHLFLIARPYSKLSLAICLFCLAGLIASFIVAGSLFGLERHLPPNAWLLLSGAVLLAYPSVWFSHWAFRRLATRTRAV